MYILNRTWDEKMSQVLSSDEFIDLMKKVETEYENHMVFPGREELFNAFKYTDYNDVKVVILGQDPYHEVNQAHGLCFSVKPENQIPRSLKNIYKELEKELGCNIPDSGCLIPWAKQGVFLLNTVLSVREGEANSHKDIGWQEFTDKVIKTLNENDNPIVFLLWGNQARKKKILLDNPNHLILECGHPSPLSVRYFWDCGHFKIANEFLTKNGLKAIDWQI